MDKFYIRYTLVSMLFFVIAQPHMLCQLSFSSHNDLIVDHNNDSYVAIGIMDFNGDYKDDILFFDDEKALNIAYQTGTNAAFEVSSQAFGFTGQAWSVTAGDIDFDGIPEVVVAYAYLPAEVYTKNQLDGEYTLWYTLENSSFFVQGSNMLDINGDGFLDVFICNDLGDNKFYINNGTGILIESALNFGTPTGQDNSGNYSASWSDYDDDGDIDMYLAKCKQGELDPHASTRINLLHSNNGDGSYTEIGRVLDLDIGAQSWTAEFGDVDNDGDMDLLIINHGEPHQLLLQQADGSFMESTGFASIVEDNFGLQGMFVDLDNNGFQDIVISGDVDYIYYNQGNDLYVIDPFPFAAQDANSIAFGDLNQDGFLDAYISYYTGLGSNINFPDALYLNDGNNSNFATFSLLGSDDNPSAIGSKITLYTQHFRQIREVKSGQSYGILNSLKLHFGLAQESIIDSLVVRWPNGEVESYYQLEVNKHYLIEKGECITNQREIEYTGNLQLCASDTVALGVPLSPGESIKWNNGSNMNEIEATQAATYKATITDSEGCMHVTDNVAVENDDPVQIAKIYLEDGQIACLGETLTATVPGFDKILWDDGDTSQVKILTKADSIWARAIGDCAEYDSDTLSVNFIDPDTFESDVDTVKKGEDAIITIINSSADSAIFSWFPTETSNVLLDVGKEFIIEHVELDTFVYVSSHTILAQEISAVGIDSSQRQGAYSSDGINAGMIFDVEKDCILHSVDISTDIKGIRLIMILDEQGTPVFNKQVSLEEGVNTVNLSAVLPAGNDYVLTTDPDQNSISFGHLGPRLTRNDQGVFYPYLSEGILSIKRSTFGPDNYYYFYNWQVSLANKECFSERRRVEVIVDTSTHTLDQYLNAELKVYPNPTMDVVYVEGVEQVSIRLLSLDGREILSSTNQLFLDVSSLRAGLYLLEVGVEGEYYFTKLIIQ